MFSIAESFKLISLTICSHSPPTSHLKTDPEAGSDLKPVHVSLRTNNELNTLFRV